MTTPAGTDDSIFTKIKRTLLLRPLFCGCMLLMLTSAALLFAPLTVKEIVFCIALAVAVIGGTVKRKSFTKKALGGVLLVIGVSILLSSASCIFSYDRCKAPLLALAEKGEKAWVECHAEEKIYVSSVSSLYKMSLTRLGGKRVSDVYMLAEFEPGKEPPLFERLAGDVTLRLPDSSDPGFDSVSYYRSKGIFAVCDGGDLQDTRVEASTPFRWLYELRNALKNDLQTHTDETTGSFVSAFLFGDKSGLPDAFRRDMKTLGLSHLLAVSGLHLSIFTAMLGFLLRRLRAGVKLRSILMILFTLCYMALCGFTLSVVRAGIMLIFYLLARLFNEKSEPMTSLLLSGAVITFVSPFSLYDYGFLMSFFATLGILIYSSYEQKSRAQSQRPTILREIFKLLAVSLAAQIAVLPVVIFAYGSFSLLSAPATLLFSPLVTLLLLLLPFLLIFCRIPYASTVVLTVFRGVCVFFTRTASLAKYVKDFHVGVPVWSAFVLIALLAVPLFFLLYGKKPKRAAVSLLAIYAAFSVVFFVRPYFLRDCVYTDVYKKNDLMLLVSAKKQYIVDLSDGSKSCAKIAVGRLYDEFLDLGPEAYVLTHYHTRHIGTLAYLCENCYLETVYLPQPIENDENEEGLYVRLSEVCEDYGVKTVTYRRDLDVIDVGGIRCSNFKRTYLKRSTHPVFSFDLTLGNETFSVFSASAQEVWTPRENANVYFLVHGPVVKKELPEDFPSRNLLFATAEQAALYGRKDGIVALLPTKLLDKEN